MIIDKGDIYMKKQKGSNYVFIQFISKYKYNNLIKENRVDRNVVYFIDNSVKDE